MASQKSGKFLGSVDNKGVAEAVRDKQIIKSTSRITIFLFSIGIVLGICFGVMQVRNAISGSLNNCDKCGNFITSSA